MQLKTFIVACSTTLIALLLSGGIQPIYSQRGEWPVYGRNHHGTRYQPASAIQKENVHQLEVAWTYRTMESEPEYATERRASFQATPIMLDGTLYLSTPLGRVIALDPATGEERWGDDPQRRRGSEYGD